MFSNFLDQNKSHSLIGNYFVKECFIEFQNVEKETIKIHISETDPLYRQLLHYAKYSLRTKKLSSFQIVRWPEDDNELPYIGLRNLQINPLDHNVIKISCDAENIVSCTSLIPMVAHSLLNSIDDVVLITETNSIDKPGPRVIFANSAFERMTGYKAIDILGKSPRLLQGKETNSNSSQQIRQALLKWKPIRIELTNYRKNQETFRVELNIAPGADETGWWTHWIAIQRDINEEMHKSRLLALGELAAGIGHEINNPLAIANGYVERIRVYLKNTNTVIPQIEEYIQKYMLASNRISIIVKGMRNLARKEVLELQQINAREAIEECLSLVAENFNQQGINIKNELCSEVAWILGDSGRLQQCLLNLLTNSRDSVLLGPIKQIIVKLEIIKDEVIFRVIDSGTGISKSDQFKIFQPFFTTKPVGKGTGIGLSTVFSMIHEMNGKIEFENLKSGVEFRLTFPLLKSDKIKK